MASACSRSPPVVAINSYEVIFCFESWSEDVRTWKGNVMARKRVQMKLPGMAWIRIR